VKYSCFFFILIDSCLILSLKYKERDLFQNTLQTFPKQYPPKIITQQYQVWVSYSNGLKMIWIGGIGVKQKTSTWVDIFIPKNSSADLIE
tara:strand:- start:616 stop:885 length:270 start_codon:yes stop_codon:yes gene_type:complete